MFYNRRPDDPLNPEWIGVRGTSKQEGRHPYYHASLPGTNYSPHLAGTIMDCRPGEVNVKSAGRQRRTTARGLVDAHQQEKKRAILKLNGWNEYALPAALPLPATTEERFGLDFTPAGDALAAALLAQQTGKATSPPTPEEEAYFGGRLSRPSLHAGCMHADMQIYNVGIKRPPCGAMWWSPQLPCLELELSWQHVTSMLASQELLLFPAILHRQNHCRMVTCGSLCFLHMCFSTIDDGEGLVPQLPSVRESSSTPRQMPLSAPAPSPPLLEMAMQPSDSRPPLLSPSAAGRAFSYAKQPKPSSPTFSSLRGVQWTAQAGSSTLHIPCVICYSLFQ